MFSTRLFDKKKIVIGVTGCIAAYKTCHLVRHLMQEGASVRVMMTRGATHFITPLTLESLSQTPVYTDMFPENQFAATHHVDLADWADACAIVPATGNTIGKIANGIGDDFLSTTVMAMGERIPIMIAPAMNHHMWFSAAVQRNIGVLAADGKEICYPEEGYLAEGYEGVGRLARLEFLVQSLYRAMHPAPQSLQGKTVVVTAGATREYLDPVRFLSNRSTGKMGYAIAWEAYARGAKVVLIHGPGHLTAPMGVELVSVESAEDMFVAANDYFDDSDIYVSAAAVADYRPELIYDHKLKKGERNFPLHLERTRDVLQIMGARKKGHQRLIGFAVETEDPVGNARHKMIKKYLDMIVLNNPHESGAAFEHDTNVVTLIDAAKEENLPVMPKLDVAREIFEFLLNG